MLQGCTASGSLFVLAINPFLELLNITIGPRDICRAFEDDVGPVIETIETLPKIANVSDIVKRSSNLRVKTTKCVIIPLGGS